jgi:hypothetical protein
VGHKACESKPLTLVLHIDGIEEHFGDLFMGACEVLAYIVRHAPTRSFIGYSEFAAQFHLSHDTPCLLVAHSSRL